MHNIGKIGIPVRVLLKQGPMFEIMKFYTEIGYRMLSDSRHEKVRLAASIALSHHEKWDGSGYLRGFKGYDIPTEGMIVLMQPKETVGQSEHFSPKVLKAFARISPEFEFIFSANTPNPEK